VDDEVQAVLDLWPHAYRFVMTKHGQRRMYEYVLQEIELDIEDWYRSYGHEVRCQATVPYAGHINVTVIPVKAIKNITLSGKVTG
jgi:hypothetical protein